MPMWSLGVRTTLSCSIIAAASPFAANEAVDSLPTISAEIAYQYGLLNSSYVGDACWTTLSGLQAGHCVDFNIVGSSLSTKSCITSLNPLFTMTSSSAFHDELKLKSPTRTEWFLNSAPCACLSKLKAMVICSFLYFEALRDSKWDAAIIKWKGTHGSATIRDLPMNEFGNLCS